MVKKLVLKPTKEKAIKNRHHWIFSGAVKALDAIENGDLIQVYSSTNEKLGTAYINTRSSILGRMVAFGDEEPKEAIQKSLQNAFDLRKNLFDEKSTNAFRLVNAEGDFLPV